MYRPIGRNRRSKHRESTTRLKLGAHTPLRLQTLTPVSFSHKNTRFTAGNKHTTNAAWRLMKPAMSYVCLWTLTGRRQDGALMSHTLGHTSAPQKWVSHTKQYVHVKVQLHKRFGRDNFMDDCIIYRPKLEICTNNYYFCNNCRLRELTGHCNRAKASRMSWRRATEKLFLKRQQNYTKLMQSQAAASTSSHGVQKTSGRINPLYQCLLSVSA